MPTWQNTSFDALKAAQALRSMKYWRSSVSRSHYSAYGAVTGRLPAGMHFRYGRSNPGHDQLPRLVRQLVSRADALSAIKDLKLLRHLREDADYRPGISVGVHYAIQALHCAGRIARLMEVI